MDYKANSEQQNLIANMLKLRREYMVSVDLMFESIRPTVQNIQQEHGAEEAITYLYAVYPDCVPRVLMINTLLGENK